MPGMQYSARGAIILRRVLSTVSLLCALSLSVAFGDAGTGLVGHWRMNDSGDTQLVRSWRSELPGRLLDPSGDARTQAHSVFGKVDHALALDGVDDVIQIPDYPGLDLAAAWSVAFWLRNDDPSRSDEAFLVGKATTKRNERAWQIVWNGQAHEWRLSTSWGGPTRTYYRFPGTLTAGVWRHVAVVYDSQATAGQRFRLFVDGVAVAPSHVVADSGEGTEPNREPVTIGALPTGSGFTKYLRGAIDDLRIYSCVIDSSDVAALYASGSGTEQVHAMLMFDGPILQLGPALEYTTFRDSLVDRASGTGVGVVSFTKTAGPAWLDVAATGELVGTPTREDLGTNEWVIRASENGEMTTGTLRITVSAWDVTSATLGRWALDDSDMTATVTDAFGRYPGSLQDPSGNPTTRAHSAVGRLGNGLQFDGTDDSVVVPDLPSNGASLALSMWVRHADSGRDCTIAARGNTDEGNGWEFSWDGQRQEWCFEVAGGGTTGVDYRFAHAEEPSRWYHLAVLYNSSAAVGERVLLYVNGQRLGLTCADSDSPATGGGGTFRLSADTTGISCFAGELDEVRLFARALSGTEVAALYASARGTTCSSSLDSMPAPGLGGIEVRDSDPTQNLNARTQTNQTSVTVRLVSPRNYVETVLMAEDQNFTRNVQFHTRPPLGQYAGGADLPYSLLPTEGSHTVWTVLANPKDVSSPPTSSTIRLDMTAPLAGDLLTTASNPTATIPFSVTVVFSEAVHDFTVDDVLLGGVGGTVTNLTGTGTTYRFLVLPSGEGVVTVQVPAGAAFDAAGNPSRASTVLSIEYVPPLRQNLLGHWALDETSGLVAADSSRETNPGTLMGGASWSRGGIQLDGTSGRVEIPNPAKYAITGPMTVSAWVLPNGTPTTSRMIISKGDYSGWYLQWLPQYKTVTFLVSGVGSKTATVTLTDGKWHHLAGVWDGAYLRIYLDGKQLSAGAATGNPVVRSYPLALGKNTQTPGQYWQGWMDDARVYSRALGAGEVQQLVNETVPIEASFVLASSTVQETAGQIALDVSLTRAAQTPVSVDYAVTAGTASLGTDYTGGTGTLTFAPGQLTASIPLLIVQSNQYEDAETITISLTAAHGAEASVGSRPAHTVTIARHNVPDLRLRLRMNEGSGTVAHDSSDMNNDATVLGDAVWATDGLLLDGLNDGLVVVNKWPFDPAGPFSIGSWVRFDGSFQGTQTIISKGSWNLQWRPSAKVLEFWASGVSAGGSTLQPGLANGAWHHVAAVWDGSRVHLYVDAHEAASFSGTGTPSGSNNSVSLGMLAGSTNTQFLKGAMCEAFFYAKGLSALDIEQLAEATVPGQVSFSVPTSTVDESCGVAPVALTLTRPFDTPITVTYAVTGGTATQGTDFIPPTGVVTVPAGQAVFPIEVSIVDDTEFEEAETVEFTLLSVSGANVTLGAVTKHLLTIARNDVSDLRLALRLDDDHGTTATDSSVFGHDGALGPDGQTGPRWMGGALFFDGIDDYVRVAPSQYLNSPDVLTAAAWVKLDLTAEGKALETQTVIGGEEWSLRSSSGTMQFYVRGLNTNTISTRTRVDDGHWHHIGAIYDGSSLAIYVDGSLDNAIETSGQRMIVPNRDYTVGAQLITYDETPHYGCFWYGMLYDVRYYARALSDQEMTLLPGALDNFEVSRGTVPVGDRWTTITLANTYASPVVVAGVQSPGGSQPLVARVRAVHGNTFQVCLQAPGSPDAPTTATVHYLAMEEGAWAMPDGTLVEAARVPVTETLSAANWTTSALAVYPYKHQYQSPVVLGQIMTANDPRWQVFATCGETLADAPSAGACRVGRLVGEDSETTRSAETLGVIVFDRNLAGAVRGIPYESLLTTATIGGAGDTPPYLAYLSAFHQQPEVAVPGQATQASPDGSWAVLWGGDVLRQASLGLALEEDQCADTERSHQPECVGAVVFETAVATHLWTHPNSAPYFLDDPIVGRDGMRDWNYTGSIGGYARDDDDFDDVRLAYSKVSGPAWLKVSPDGLLSGVPYASNLGRNEFRVHVEDPRGAWDEAVLVIDVLDHSDQMQVGSPVSPAWVEMSVQGWAQGVSAQLGDGSPLATVRESPERAYIDNSSATGGSLGVVLDPAAATTVQLTMTFSAGSFTTSSQTITWEPTDLAGRSGDGAAPDTLFIRKGDSLLLTASAPSTATLVEIDADGDGTYELSGPSGSRFTPTYTAAGVFAVRARVDGATVGSLRVVVCAVDLQGPIAGQQYNQRPKTVTFEPAGFGDVFAFTPNDPRQLRVREDGVTTGSAIALTLCTTAVTTSSLQARLGGPDGPIVSAQPVNAFTLDLVNSLYARVVTTFANGDREIEFVLQMRPVVPGLIVHNHVYAPGATFLDSTIDQYIPTEEFDFLGHYKYYIICPPIISGACHWRSVYQDGVRITP